MAAQNQIKAYKDAVKKSGSKEAITWIVFNKDYSPIEKRSFERFAKRNGIAPPVYVGSADEVINYVNSKTTTTTNLSNARSKDVISDLSVMSHGVPAAVALGYGNNSWTGRYDDPSVVTFKHISNVDAGSFAANANIDLYSCNSATPFDLRSANFSSQGSLIEKSISGDNLIKSLSNRITTAKVTGYIGQTSYRPVGNGGLPLPGTMDGSYSPTVNNEKVPTLKVTMQDGKVKNP